MGVFGCELGNGPGGLVNKEQWEENLEDERRYIFTQDGSHVDCQNQSGSFVETGDGVADFQETFLVLSEGRPLKCTLYG